ncbi:hypothetical protein ACROYT_G008193 [Oculina patagonica]
MLSDRRYPCFSNFNSAISIDVIRVKSYLDSLFDPACVSEKQASVSPHIDPTPRVDKNKWVINLSSRPLSDAEVSLLEKGLNFAVTPTTIPATEIVAKVETAIRALDSEQADTIRRTVNSVLQQAEPPKPNVTKEMHEALNNLKQFDSIMILPADKGRASVVLDTNTYHDKMKALIETGPYQLLNKDPTDRLSRKLTEKLLSLKRSGHLSETIYNKIRPKHKQPPRIYGQPKIHKPNTPLRPIVSCINTFAYDLWKALFALCRTQTMGQTFYG